MSSDQSIRHRVTGAIVLISLAIIFLPLILDGKKKNQILESSIPEKPVTGEIVLINLEQTKNKKQLFNQANNEKPTKTQINLSSKVTKPVVKDNLVSSTTETVSNDKPVQKAKSKPIAKIVKEKVVIPVQTTEQPEARTTRPKFKASAYVIQLGVFGNKSNATKLVNKLKKAGYKAYLRQGKLNNKQITRVIVGPELEQKSATSKIADLNKISGLKARILGYDPLIH